MALLTTQGATPVARWQTEHTVGATLYREHWALRSDGALLRKIAWTASAGERRPYSDGYRIDRKLRPIAVSEPERVTGWLTRRLGLRVVSFSPA